MRFPDGENFIISALVNHIFGGTDFSDSRQTTHAHTGKRVSQNSCPEALWPVNQEACQCIKDGLFVEVNPFSTRPHQNAF